MNSFCRAIKFRGLVSTVVIFFISAIFYSCEKNNIDASAKLNKMNFELVILDEQDIEAASFDHGTDVKFALKLINNSNQDFEWNHDYSCRLLQSEDFLLVYKFFQDDELNAYYLLVGQPYLSPINCETINFPPQPIPPGESLIINLSWSDNPENKPLTKGKYYTVSKFELQSEGEKREWNLRSDFEIF